MKIALVIHHFPPNYSAGSEQYAFRVAKGLTRLEQTVEVICIESITEGNLEPQCVTEQYEGLTVHRLHFDSHKAPNFREWMFRNPELGKWFKTYLQQNRPDIVHINSGYLLGGTIFQAAFDLHIPTVLTVHDYWFMCPRITLLRTNGKICDKPVEPEYCVWCSLLEKRRFQAFNHFPLRTIGEQLFVSMSRLRGVDELLEATPFTDLTRERRQYLKQILEQVDLALFPSRFLMRKIEEYGFALRRKVYLPFQVNITQRVQPAKAIPGRLRIGYLGQFTFHKGVHLLISAFQQLKQGQSRGELFLYGNTEAEPHYIEQLRRMARGRADIHFMGAYPNHEVGLILNGLDVIVTPSLWYENRPTVIVEAYAMQTPVIAARIGGMAEMVCHGQNGLLFEPGNVHSLAEQLQRLIDQPELLTRLQAGIQTDNAQEDEITTLIGLYQSLLPH